MYLILYWKSVGALDFVKVYFYCIQLIFIAFLLIKKKPKRLVVFTVHHILSSFSL
jgi:hypothetical protein